MYIKAYHLMKKLDNYLCQWFFSEQDSSHYKLSLNLVKTHKVGGLIFSLGGPVEQSQWLNNFQSLAKTPLLIAMDAEWGVAMRLDSIKAFPWPMTLGAVKDTSLLRAIGNRMGGTRKTIGYSL